MHSRTPEQKMFIDRITKELNGLNTARSREKTETSDTLGHIHCIDSLLRIFQNPLYDNKFFDELRKTYEDTSLSYETKAKEIREKIFADFDKEDPQVERNKERYDIHKNRGSYFKNNPDDPNEDPKIESDRIKELEKWAGVSNAQVAPRKAPVSDPVAPTAPKHGSPQRSYSAPQASALQQSSMFKPQTPPTTTKSTRKTLKCELVVAADAPTKETIASLPIQSSRAYVRFGDDLYYVNKARQSCKKLEVDAATVSRFDATVKPREDARTLKSRELDVVAEIIGNKGHNYKKEERISNSPKV